jgi:hypothetical protein
MMFFYELPSCFTNFSSLTTIIVITMKRIADPLLHCMEKRKDDHGFSGHQVRDTTEMSQGGKSSAPEVESVSSPGHVSVGKLPCAAVLTVVSLAKSNSSSPRNNSHGSKSNPPAGTGGRSAKHTKSGAKSALKSCNNLLPCTSINWLNLI